MRRALPRGRGTGWPLPSPRWCRAPLCSAWASARSTRSLWTTWPRRRACGRMAAGRDWPERRPRDEGRDTHAAATTMGERIVLAGRGYDRGASPNGLRGPRRGRWRRLPRAGRWPARSGPSARDLGRCARSMRIVPSVMMTDLSKARGCRTRRFISRSLTHRAPPGRVGDATAYAIMGAPAGMISAASLAEPGLRSARARRSDPPSGPAAPAS